MIALPNRWQQIGPFWHFRTHISLFKALLRSMACRFGDGLGPTRKIFLSRLRSFIRSLRSFCLSLDHGRSSLLFGKQRLWFILKFRTPSLRLLNSAEWSRFFFLSFLLTISGLYSIFFLGSLFFLSWIWAGLDPKREVIKFFLGQNSLNFFLCNYLFFCLF